MCTNLIWVSWQSGWKKICYAKKFLFYAKEKYSSTSIKQNTVETNARRDLSSDVISSLDDSVHISLKY